MIDIETYAEQIVVSVPSKRVAFLIDEIMSPLCSVYQSELYTKEMQEFLTKTTDDFEQDKVLNLDEDKTNNFAVYKDNVKKIEGVYSKNIVVSANNETGVYVLENIDSTIKNLKNGDIFAYTYDGKELIVKVDSVVVNGTTATIYSQETSLDEVFDYVKIDNTGDLSDATVDTSSLDEDVIYNGLVEDTKEEDAYSEEGIMPEVEIEGGIGASFSHTIKEKKLGSDDNYVKVSGDLKFSAEAKVKVYITFSCRYLEVRLDCSVKISLKAEGKGEGKLKLTTIGMAICPGVYLEFTPSFVVQANITAELSGKLSATIGFRYSSDEGFENISSAPKFDSQLKVEGTLFIGLSLEPKLVIVSEKVAKASIEAEVGIELKAVIDSKNEDTENVKHECTLCIDGDISAKAKVSASVKFLNKDKWSLGIKLFDINHKIGDFYYSLTFGDYGIRACSHFKYRVNVNVCDSDGQKLGNVNIVADEHEYETDDKGHAEFFVNEGKIIFTFLKTGYETYKKEVKIYGKAIELDNKAKEIFVKLTKKNGGTTGNEGEEQGKLKIRSQTVSLGGNHSAVITEDGSLYLWGDNYYGKLGNETWYNSNIPIKIMENVASVSLGRDHSAAITKEGSLYLWGNSYYGQLGNGTTNLSSTPIKIMENVISVSLGWYHSAVITKDKDLYLWGRNEEKQLGNGTQKNSSFPIKVMENVASVSLGVYHSTAITKEGSLYLWGNNNSGQLGNGTKEDSSIPIKVMENVVSVSLGNSHSAAITEGGNLYLWGDNYYAQLGNGIKRYSSTPIKIMGNVANISLGAYHSAAIMENGNLYLWGDNRYGQLGDGTKKRSSTPIKIMENVASVSLGWRHSAAITKQGDLYLWGFNDEGQLGNGTTQGSSTPIKIMENVASVSLGWQHSAAVTKDGSLYLWGYNYSHQLGDSGKRYSSVPIKIMENIESVNLGDTYSAAITKDGSLYMWGSNDYGQLGNGATSFNSSIPIKIIENVVSVNLGSDYSAAITQDRSLYLWGRNDEGQLGNSAIENSNVPIKIMQNVTRVSLGNYHSTTITQDKNLYIWGYNYYSQLGNGITSYSDIPIKIMDNVKLLSSEPSTHQVTFSTQTLYIPTAYNQPMSTALNTTSSSFTNLTPNVEYIFYIVKSEETEKDLLSADNLLYINQGKADENGNLAFNFNNKTEWANAKTFLIGGIGDGNITLDDAELTCVIAPETTVEQLKEKLHKRFQLVDSDNIEITDNKSFIQSGNILYLFDSKGEVAKRYTIGIIGDVNKDGIINIQDAVILKRRLAGYSDLRLSEKASDINGDGILNIRDAVILLKYCAGMNVQLGKQ